MRTENIIKGLLDNNKKVINYIYNNYFKVIHAYIINNKGTHEDAWDIFQESLMIAFEKLRLDPDCIHSSFPGYLYGICKYRWIRKLNEKNMNEEDISLLLNDNYFPKFEFDRVNNDIESLSAKEHQDRVFQEAYINLKIDCQQIIDMVINGCTIEDIAEFMKYTSVKYTFRKRQQCKERLIDYIKTELLN